MMLFWFKMRTFKLSNYISSIRCLNSNLVYLSKRWIEGSNFKIADYYTNALKELPDSYKKQNFFTILESKDFKLKLRRDYELSKEEENILRYHTFLNYSDSDLLDLDSEFRVLTTSTINPEIESLISDYKESWDDNEYVNKMKSFLEQERILREKLLPFMKDFTLLPDEYLDEIDELIDPYLSFMAWIIYSIRKRGGGFVLKEAECMSIWETWRYIIWILRDVRDNPKKWVVEEKEFLDSVEFTTPFNLLEDFLRYLIIIAKLNFEDNVLLLTQSSSFMNLNVKLVDTTDDEELNEFNQVETKMESFEESFDQVKTKMESFWFDKAETLSELLKGEELLEDKRELEQGKKELINDQVKFKLADHYMEIKEEDYEFLDVLYRLNDEINPKRGDELSEEEKKVLRYYCYYKMDGRFFLDLDSEFRVLATSRVDPEIESLVDDYEESWDTLDYVDEMKSFLEQEKVQREKLLPFIEDFTLLPDEHLDEIDEFIDSHLSFMAKVVLSIDYRHGNFVLREVECMFRWESWRYLSWVLRDVRNNKGKWMINYHKALNSIGFIIPFNFLEDFLRYLIINTKLGFEDNVLMITKNPLFAEVKLVETTDDERLNEFIKVEAEEESFVKEDWFEKTETLSGTPTQWEDNYEAYLSSDRERLRREEQLLRDNQGYLSRERRELDNDMKVLNNDRAKLELDKETLNSDKLRLNNDKEDLSKEQARLKKDRKKLKQDNDALNDMDKKAREQVGILLNEIKVLEDQKGELSGEVEMLGEQLKKGEKELEKGKKEVEKLKKTRTELNSETKGFKDELTHLQVEKENLEKEKDNLTKYVKNLKTQRKNLENKVEELSKKK